MSREQIKAIFERMTSEFLFPLLESNGFQRGPGRLNCHTKQHGDVEYRVCAWMKQRPRQDVAIVEVTAGVAFRRLWEFLKDCDVFARTEMYTATGCGGLFTIIFPRDVWPSWASIDANSDPDVLGREVVDQFERFVFPFLEHYSYLDHALEYWRGSLSFEGMARVAAMSLRGDKAKAFAELDERITKAESEARESQRPGDFERVGELRRFRNFLESADMASRRNA